MKSMTLNKCLVSGLFENELGVKAIYPQNEDEIFGLFMKFSDRSKTQGLTFYKNDYDYEILYKMPVLSEDDEAKSPTWIQLLNIREIEKYLDISGAIPNWVFRYKDGETVLEEKISLVDWLKNYAFSGLIDELQEKWNED